MDPTLIVILVVQCVQLIVSAWTHIKHSSCASCCMNCNFDMDTTNIEPSVRTDIDIKTDNK
jgi:hypothetical protein